MTAVAAKPVRQWLGPAALLLAAALLRVVSSATSPMGGDSRRFLEQSRDLATKHWGFLGDPFTTLPPGYPLFIRAVGWVSPSVTTLLAVQFALSLLTPALVYLAVRRRNAPAALPALAFVALNPWLARQQSLVMSETLAAFLVALLLFLLPPPDDALRAGRAFLLGAVAASSVLVAPALALLVAPCGLVFVLQRRRERALIAAAVAGLLVVLAPWELYCREKTGRWEPTIIHRYSLPKSGLQQWLATWVEVPQDISLWWSRKLRERVPRGAFTDAAERRQVQGLLRALPLGINRYPLGSAEDRALLAVAARRTRQSPFRVRVLLPAIRGATLWLPVRPRRDARLLAARAGPGAGVRDRRPRAGTVRAIALGLQTFNLAMLVFFVVGGVRAVRLRDAAGAALVGGVVLYTLLSAVSAAGESRRNLPFFPALAAVWAVGRRERPDDGRPA